MSLLFEWNEDKARANVRKHGVTFEESASVFADPSAAIFNDEAHSEEESREIMVERSANGRLLVVSFTHGTRRDDPHPQRPTGRQSRAEEP